MELRELVPHMVAMVAGGLGASLGLSWSARKPRGRALLGRIKWWGVAVFATVAVGGLVGGFYWMFRRVSEHPNPEELFRSPWVFLLMGSVIGLPFSLPGVLTAWSDARPAKVAAREQKRKSATERDRLEFAHKLVEQIKEFSQTPREVSASLSDEKGTVLVFSGDLGREEGDRLVAALRDEMTDLGFKRVEGDGGRVKWWTRV
ncbi:MAG: hypothetical protein IIB36_20445 [Gemmatimonadetes bacterium]|nr:hypothetical protein [Gemmatimonadota bacterium]